MPERLTPLLSQYRRVKEQYPDALLLFRVGDFYEMFYDDAATGAQALGLVLTSRPHGPENVVPLAGVPARALDTYIARLVAKGFKVAVCDQLEEPSKGKPVVRRDVTEVITPGTLTRPNLLDDKRNNYLLAVSPAGDTRGIAFADVSTGEFSVGEVPSAALAEEVKKLEPRELLLPAGADLFAAGAVDSRITRLDDYYFTQDYAFDKLATHFGVANLEGFGITDLTEGVCAAGAVLHYLEQTQKNAVPHLRRLSAYRAGASLYIDKFTRRNLELVEPLHPDPQSPPSTLYSVLDQTRTPAGARLLRRWLLAPLLDTAAIRERQDVVEELTAASSPLERLQDALARIGDIERVASRIALERAGARDLVALRDWLLAAPEVRDILAGLKSGRLAALRAGMPEFATLVEDVSNTLVDDPPLALNEGGLIRQGVSAELDELRALASGAKEFIAKLQDDERRRTGIPNLRVRFNSVFGYYIEVTKSYLAVVPKNYIRKQTVLNAERFITPELKEYEARILHSEGRICALENELFVSLRRRVAEDVARLLDLSRALAELDALGSLARVARDRRYVRPVVDDSTVIEIAAGRHPVVEALSGQPFVANDTRCDTEEEQVLIITGPNMAGKSTYLRQVALLTVMAQTGSFVPADKARIGICDKVFTRIGASDDLARGVSTFLAEMAETANILNNASHRSLVILDEVGRGTSTNDGLALAWATVEHLHGGGPGPAPGTGSPGLVPESPLQTAVPRPPPPATPKTLFATHYRELTDLPTLLPRCRNYSFQVREHKDRVIFLRRIKPGPADKSYGIAVAKLAGIPEPVIRRARELIDSLARAEQQNLAQALDLAIAADRAASSGRQSPPDVHQSEVPAHPVLSRLRSVDLNSLSPLQALNLLAELQRLTVEA